jgi:ATP-dependent DNA helicase RecG
MNQTKLRSLIAELRSLPKETEWFEFKVNKSIPREIGEYISALSNSASLHNKPSAYLIFGIENITHNVVGTKFKPKQKKKGNEELENWIARQLTPRIDFVIHEFQHNQKPMVVFEIDAAKDTPVKFNGVAYVRVGTYKKRLSDYPEKERKIWKKEAGFDWSAQICEGATIDDLDNEAIDKARIEYKRKDPHLAEEVDSWDDATFLNKAKVTIQGDITRAAIILLGKGESEHFLSPSVAKITWLLKDEHNQGKDYAHFGPPFILNVEKVFAKVRNLNYRYLPDGRLFPIEITQYDSWVIREALHNCIAHQDYDLHGRINVVEKPDELLFTNLGDFIPGDVETVIQQDSPQDIYRNPFLATAMVNLNMIDTIGSGIKKMFLKQKQRFFPLPDYDLRQPDKVSVKIPGKILDENYTRILINKTDLDLPTVILLDKVQKKIKINPEEHQYLRKRKMTEGRYPNIFISAEIAAAVGKKAKYIKDRGLEKQYYQNLIISYLEKHKQASRKDIDELLFDKMPEVLNDVQKRTKIKNLIYEMSKKLNVIENRGTSRKPVWVLTMKT